jgi:hypothetical protein
VSPCCDWPNGSAFAVVVETPLGVFELQSTPMDSELTRMPLTQRAGESYRYSVHIIDRWPSWTLLVSVMARQRDVRRWLPPPCSHPARSQDRPQFHPCEALVEPRISAQAVPLRRDREMNYGKVARVD